MKPDEFMARVKREIVFEWKYEKQARAVNDLTNWGVWLFSVGLVVLGAIATGDPTLREKAWLANGILAFSALNLGLPILRTKCQQRQGFHDRTARAYTTIETDFESGRINLHEAIERFNRLYKRPPESTIRRTP